MPLSLITPDDFHTLISVIRDRGLKFLISKLKLSESERVKTQWDNYKSSGSNWWEIPAVRERWNLKITGSKHETWEEYISRNYITNQTNFRVLSVGCGSGEKERSIACYAPLINIEGIDISKNSVLIAEAEAQKANSGNLVYSHGDFSIFPFPPETFNIVLFNSSLHHFTKIEKLIITKVLPVLKPGGLVVMFEYAGPNRFQYTNSQIAAANSCLKLLPSELRTKRDKTFRSKVYRPGWLRMWLNDPSEAPCAEDILPVLHKHMMVVEEKAVGGTLLHPLLKGIAHNFMDERVETNQILDILFLEEDRFTGETGQSDFWFGVYRKK